MTSLMNYNTCMTMGFVNVPVTSLPIIPGRNCFSGVTANELLVDFVWKCYHYVNSQNM